MTDHEAHNDNDFTVLQPHSAPPGHSTDENVKDDSKNVGEAAGSFLGGVGGMALGIAGGPIGLVIGAIAGAVGGWWAGRGVAEAFTSEDEAAYRTHYTASPHRLADRDYDSVAPAYVTGHLAGRNPEYAGRTFDQVEPDLQRGWGDEVGKGHGQWPAMRGYAQVAFDRARGAITRGE